MKEVQVLPKK